MQAIEKYLNIIDNIKNNVENSDPEIALYLVKILKEIDQDSEEISKLEELSQSTNGTNYKLISSNLEKIKEKLKLNTKPFSFHIKGYVGGAIMIVVILLLTNFFIQKEKLKRDAVLMAKFSPWKVSYFCNEKLEGSPCNTETKDNINIDWGGKDPAQGVSGGSFSARFESCLEILDHEQEVYFSIGSDDGNRIIIDGEMITESWKIQGFDTKTVSVSLPSGKHKLSVEYYQGGGASRFELKAGPYKTKTEDPKIDSNLKC